MIERYHLGLAAAALVGGVVVLVAVVSVPWLRTRAVASTAACGALVVWIGGAAGDGVVGDRGAALWPVAAALLVVPADDDRRPHPLGRFTLVLTVVALAGIWAAVPDTEAPLAVALTLTPLASWHLIKGTVPGPVGTAAVVVAVLGAAWVGSAGWGSALASMGSVGLIATAPLLNGFREVADRSALSVLVGLQSVVGLLLPRLVMSRAVHVASGLSIAVNALLVLVSIVILGLSPGRSEEQALR